MKSIPLYFVAASAMVLSSCVDPYLAGDISSRSDRPMILERQPVVVERRGYVEERPPVTVERYSRTYAEPGTRTYVEPRSSGYNESRPYYGEPAPTSTYQRRTTTRTYQDY